MQTASRGLGQRVPAVSNTSTQSPSPVRLRSGGRKVRFPTFAIGAFPMSVKLPSVGSYQRAKAGPASRVMSTAVVRRHIGDHQ
jgi:hypothetical protein